MEIEQKYLVRQLPEHLGDFEQIKMIQGYLSKSPVIRIRKENENYILTYKSKANQELGVIVNQEVELALTEDAFNHLKHKTDDHLVYKTRYNIPLGEYTAELDIFEQQLQGLIIVEVEFPSVDAAKVFTPPQWFGANVSDDVRYSNAYLSTLDSFDNKISF